MAYPAFRTFIRQAEQVSGSFSYDDTLTMSTAESYLAKSLEQDLNYLRSQIKIITGESNWYDAPNTTLTNVPTEAAISGSLNNIFSFTGMADRNEGTPTYSSTEYATGDLEAAIGALDAQVKANYDGYTSLTLDDVCEQGAITDVALVVQASGSTFSSILSYEDIHAGNDILVEGTVDGVDLSAFSSATQTFTGMDSETDSTPTYTSTNYVANSDSLETAIGKLDAGIAGADATKVVERLGSPLTSGSTHVIPGSNGHSAGNGSYMDVFINGQLLQSNTGTELRDYLESDTDEITFTFDIPANSYVVYIIRA